MPRRTCWRDFSRHASSSSSSAMHVIEQRDACLLPPDNPNGEFDLTMVVTVLDNDVIDPSVIRNAAVQWRCITVNYRHDAPRSDQHPDPLTMNPPSLLLDRFNEIIELLARKISQTARGFRSAAAHPF